MSINFCINNATRVKMPAKGNFDYWDVTDSYKTIYFLNARAFIHGNEFALI